jgi:hypothetical protein
VWSGESVSTDREVTVDILEIVNCVWDNDREKNDWGCAVYCASDKQTISIRYATFAHCVTKWVDTDGKYGYGGALSLRCSTLTITGCCGFYCAAYHWGQFLWLSGDGPTCDISSSTFVGCGHRSESLLANRGDHGVIEVAESFATAAADLNFTDSYVVYDGAAILMRSGSNPLTVTRLTALRCAGDSVIEHTGSAWSVISFCNFYGTHC